MKRTKRAVACFVIASVSVTGSLPAAMAAPQSTPAVPGAAMATAEPGQENLAALRERVTAKAEALLADRALFDRFVTTTPWGNVGHVALEGKDGTDFEQSPWFFAWDEAIRTLIRAPHLDRKALLAAQANLEEIELFSAFPMTNHLQRDGYYKADFSFYDVKAVRESGKQSLYVIAEPKTPRADAKAYFKTPLTIERDGNMLTLGLQAEEGVRIKSVALDNIITAPVASTLLKNNVYIEIPGEIPADHLIFLNVTVEKDGQTRVLKHLGMAIDYAHATSSGALELNEDRMKVLKNEAAFWKNRADALVNTLKAQGNPARMNQCFEAAKALDAYIKSPAVDRDRLIECSRPVREAEASVRIQTKLKKALKDHQSSAEPGGFYSQRGVTKQSLYDLRTYVEKALTAPPEADLQDQIRALLKARNASLWMLRYDLSELKNLVKQAEKAEANVTKYKASTLQAVLLAKDEANDWIARNEKVFAAEPLNDTPDLVKKLQKALNGLQPKNPGDPLPDISLSPNERVSDPDPVDPSSGEDKEEQARALDELKSLVKKAEALDLSGYEAAGQDAFKKVLKEAQALIKETPTPAAAKLRQASKALRQAKTALVAKAPAEVATVNVAFYNAADPNKLSHGNATLQPRAKLENGKLTLFLQPQRVRGGANGYLRGLTVRVDGQAVQAELLEEKEVELINGERHRYPSAIRIPVDGKTEKIPVELSVNAVIDGQVVAHNHEALLGIDYAHKTPGFNPAEADKTALSDLVRTLQSPFYQNLKKSAPARIIGDLDRELEEGNRVLADLHADQDTVAKAVAPLAARKALLDRYYSYSQSLASAKSTIESDEKSGNFTPESIRHMREELALIEEEAATYGADTPEAQWQSVNERLNELYRMHRYDLTELDELNGKAAIYIGFELADEATLLKITAIWKEASAYAKKAKTTSALPDRRAEFVKAYRAILDPLPDGRVALGKQALRELAREAEALLKAHHKGEKVTRALEEAIAKADQAIRDPQATQDGLAAVHTALEQAVAAYQYAEETGPVKPGDEKEIAALQKALAEAVSAAEGLAKGKKSDGAYMALQKAVIAAREAQESKDIATLKKALVDLKKAVETFQDSPDVVDLGALKAALAETIRTAKALPQGDKPLPAFEALQKAIALAEAAVESDSPARLAAAKAALDKAIEAFQAAEDRKEDEAHRVFTIKAAAYQPDKDKPSMVNQFLDPTVLVTATKDGMDLILRIQKAAPIAWLAPYVDGQVGDHAAMQEAEDGYVFTVHLDQWQDEVRFDVAVDMGGATATAMPLALAAAPLAAMTQTFDLRFDTESKVDKTALAEAIDLAKARLAEEGLEEGYAERLKDALETAETALRDGDQKDETVAQTTEALTRALAAAPADGLAEAQAALAKAIDEAKALPRAGKPAKAKQALDAAIAKAEALLRDGREAASLEAAQADLAKAIETFKAASETADPKDAADTQALEKAIRRATAVIQTARYEKASPEVKAAFDQALRLAETTLAEALTKADQARVDRVAHALADAMDKLDGQTVDWSPLDKAIAKAEQAKQTVRYEKASASRREAFDAALAKAQAADRKRLGQAEMGRLLSALKDAEAALDGKDTSAPSSSRSRHGGNAGGSFSVPFVVSGEQGEAEAPKAETPKPEAPAAPTFRDTDGHWAKASIAEVAQKGLMRGTAPGLFAPEAPCDRAMLVTILFRLSKDAPVGRASFRDVPEDAYYAESVAWAKAHGIVSGTGQGRFSPQKAVSRQEMAAMIANYLKYKGELPADQMLAVSYPDITDIAPWARASIAALSQQGLLGGRDDGRFDPKAPLSRAEMATVIAKLAH